MDLGEQYWKWQRVLALEFFDSSIDVPVALFVDDDEVSRLFREHFNEGDQTLIQAVRNEVSPQQPAQVFYAIQRQVALWAAGDRLDPPPCLPVLAVSVLAASHMRNAVKYYPYLAVLLAGDEPEEVRTSLEYALRRHVFLDIVEMWETLHSWIEKLAGQAGISTIHTDDHFNRIGFPKSQALLQRRDREVLTQFFDDLDLTQRGVPTQDQLIKFLDIWSSRGRGLSRKFLDEFRDLNVRQLLAPVIHAWANRWDGRVVGAVQVSGPPIHLLIDLVDGFFGFAVEFSGQETAIPIEIRLPTSAGTITGEHRDGTKLLEWSLEDLGVPLTRDLTFEAHFGGRVAKWKSLSITVLVERLEGDGWISTQYVQATRMHMLLVAVPEQLEVEELLAKAATSDWRRQTLPGVSGFVLFCNVLFPDAEVLASALQVTRLDLFQSLRPLFAPRARLQGGLRVLRDLADNVYLSGGEPDLLLPFADKSREVDVTLDGRRQEPAFRVSGYPIPLRSAGSFEPGAHSLQVEGDELTFYVEDFRDLAEGSSFAGGRPHIELQGGYLVDEPSQPVQPILAFGYRESYAIRSDGLIRRIHEPARPTDAMNHFPRGATWGFWVDVLDADAWLVQTGMLWRFVRVTSEPPAFTKLSHDDRSVWTRIAAGAKAVPAPFHQYLDAWMNYE